MALPKFTNQENYLIYAVKSLRPSILSNLGMWTCILVGCLLAGFAAYWENCEMLLSVFVAFCVLRICEEWSQIKWVPHWRSIIEKYEAACHEGPAIFSKDPQQFGEEFSRGNDQA